MPIGIIPSVTRAIAYYMSRELGVRHVRVPYRSDNDHLEPIQLKYKDPVAQFREWFQEAVDSGVLEANAMALATATLSGIPSVRYVLLKELDERGFQFFTNYDSRKAIELEVNPHASLLFYWEPLKRQVRIEGTVSRLPVAESEAYFSQRPRVSQLSAAVSPQSRVIPSRECLQNKVAELEGVYAAQPSVPMPSNWGGYVLFPRSIEFWQGQSSRLHDRILFRRVKPEDLSSVDPTYTHFADGDWVYERLAP